MSTAFKTVHQKITHMSGGRAAKRTGGGCGRSLPQAFDFPTRTSGFPQHTPMRTATALKRKQKATGAGADAEDVEPRARLLERRGAQPPWRQHGGTSKHQK